MIKTYVLICACRHCGGRNAASQPPDTQLSHCPAPQRLDHQRQLRQRVQPALVHAVGAGTAVNLCTPLSTPSPPTPCHSMPHRANRKPGHSNQTRPGDLQCPAVPPAAATAACHHELLERRTVTASTCQFRGVVDIDQQLPLPHLLRMTPSSHPLLRVPRTACARTFKLLFFAAAIAIQLQ